jgi:hypothetical protein
MSKKDHLKLLLEKARKHKMTDQERDDQIRSLAFGNTHYENDSITKADIDDAWSSLKGSGKLEPTRS